jgi:hypothetical protein
MKNNAIANMNIGLFFSPEKLEKRTLIAGALKEAGARVQTISDSNELDRILRDTNPGLRPNAIIFENVIELSVAEDILKAEISPIAISFLPKGARVQAGDSRELGTFIQGIFTKEAQKV